MIPLILAFTPDYLVPASVVLKSLLEATPKEARYDVICLVDYTVSERLKGLLALIDKGSGRLSFRFMNLSHKLEGVHPHPKYTAAANYRLVIAEELPEYRRAIYVDCDVVIRQDIARLYQSLVFDDNEYMAGVIEASNEWQMEQMTPLGLSFGSYINSGFLVLNLEAMRRDNLSEQFRQILREACFNFPDQDAINIICKGKIRYLHPKFNGLRTFFLPSLKQDFLRIYIEEQYQVVQREATIHFTGNKPWKRYAVLFEEWWRVYYRLPKELRSELEAPTKLRLLALIFLIPGVRPLADVVLKLKRAI